MKKLSETKKAENKEIRQAKIDGVKIAKAEKSIVSIGDTLVDMHKYLTIKRCLCGRWPYADGMYVVSSWDAFNDTPIQEASFIIEKQEDGAKLIYSIWSERYWTVEEVKEMCDAKIKESKFHIRGELNTNF